MRKSVQFHSNFIKKLKDTFRVSFRLNIEIFQINMIKIKS